MEIVSWSVRASSSPVAVDRLDKVKKTQIAKPQSQRLVFESKLEKFVESGIYNRDLLNMGDQVVGPAVIVERETATIVPSQFVATVQADLCLFVEIDKQAE